MVEPQSGSIIIIGLIFSRGDQFFKKNGPGTEIFSEKLVQGPKFSGPKFQWHTYWNNQLALSYSSNHWWHVTNSWRFTCVNPRLNSQISSLRFKTVSVNAVTWVTIFVRISSPALLNGIRLVGPLATSFSLQDWFKNTTQNFTENFRWKIVKLDCEIQAGCTKL